MSAGRQQRVRDEARRLLQSGVAGQTFPGASACIDWRDQDAEVSVTSVAGHLLHGGPAVVPETAYDLASLTKPFVATAALRMVAAGITTFETRAERILGDVRGTFGGSATLEQLLTHRAGLAPWGGLYLDIPHDAGSTAAKRWILGEASRREHEERANGPVYSDLGYLIAGEMLAKIASTSLDRVVARHVTEPLGISDRIFYPASFPPEQRAALLQRTAPTERCEWRGYIVRNEVHDENSAAMGGISGHAGLFGTAPAVAVLGRTMMDVLNGRSEFLPLKLVQHALAERSGGTQRMGWDGKSDRESSAGRRLSPQSFGHLGFTGTSIWCDPDRDLVIILLSNRVHPSRANEKIKAFRPAFHDGVVAAFDG